MGAVVLSFCMWTVIAVAFGADVSIENISVSKLAFGSCNRQDLPQPLWDSIRKQKPDLFLWLGDVVYADTRLAPFVWRPSPLPLVRQRFDEQKTKPEYKRFVESGIPIFGVWDDHDYNMNDGGRENVGREEIQQIFLDFLDEDKDSWRRKRDGVYASYLLGENKQKVKLILLDVRSQLDRKTGNVLGHDQWVWLEREIADDEGAALIVVASGMQVMTEMSLIDRFSRFPQSYERLMNILSQNSKVLILSGDVHFGEISCHNTSNNAVYEVTSSGLTHTCLISIVPDCVCHWAINYFMEQKKRISSHAYSDLNYGLVTIDWNTSMVTLAVYGQEHVVLNHTYNMSASVSARGSCCPSSTHQPIGMSVFTWTVGFLLILALCRATICRYGLVQSRPKMRVHMSTRSK